QVHCAGWGRRLHDAERCDRGAPAGARAGGFGSAAKRNQRGRLDRAESGRAHQTFGYRQEGGSRLQVSMEIHDDSSASKRYEANQLFHEAYEAQLANDYERAIELYKRSIETYPTAEAHTFLGWVYSFQQRYDEAIEECLEAIRVDDTLGNPYNDIGSYLLAKGDPYGSVRWFDRALLAPRYESYALPQFNLG